MFRTLVLAAALGAMALPAAAASVTINVAGLDAKAAHAKIVQAAATACGIELSDDSTVVQYYTHAACVTDAAAKAEAKVEANQRVARL